MFIVFTFHDRELKLVFKLLRDTLENDWIALHNLEFDQIQIVLNKCQNLNYSKMAVKWVKGKCSCLSRPFTAIILVKNVYLTSDGVRCCFFQNGNHSSV